MGKKTPKQTTESVRRKLKVASDASDLTYQEIGDRMGFSPSSSRQAVSRLLDTKHDYNPRLETLLAFAEAIDRPLADILS